VTNISNAFEKNMEMQGINLNITSGDEHVPKIDRFIPTVKERKRARVNTLPFNIFPTD